MPSFRVVGPGRAGGSLVATLTAAGWESAGLLGWADDPTAAAAGIDLLVVATPDAAIGEVAARVDPVPTTVVAHLSGATGLDVLGPHVRRASVHPLVSLPDVEVGARRLRGAWFAVATEDRATYHAAAAVASNHLVALLGQVARLADAIGVPLEAYLDLAARKPESSTDPAAAELANLVTVAGALVALAGARSESRGAHTREDFPDTDDRRCRRILTRPGQASGS